MLQNQSGIIFDGAKKRSIARATAKAMHEAGTRLAFTCRAIRLKENVEALQSE